MKEIALTRGLVALVDDEDFEWLNQWKWYPIKGKHTYYACRSKMTKGKRYMIKMHSAIVERMGLDSAPVIDHHDTNGLNNQRSNLRPCTVRQNNYNRRGAVRSKTPFKGVIKHRNRWGAKIKVDGQTIALGSFGTPEEAGRHYNLAAVKYFGEFAWLNPIEPAFPTEERKPCNSRSKVGYRGVHWSKQANKWRVKINANRKEYFVGFFLDPVSAAHAFDAKAKELLGDKARLNFPDE